MRDRIRELIAEAFGLEVGAVPDHASVDVMAAWDSLHHIELMLALELEFGVEITSEAMPVLLSADAIERYLREQGVSVAA